MQGFERVLASLGWPPLLAAAQFLHEFGDLELNGLPYHQLGPGISFGGPAESGGAVSFWYEHPPNDPTGIWHPGIARELFEFVGPVCPIGSDALGARYWYMDRTGTVYAYLLSPGDNTPLVWIGESADAALENICSFPERIRIAGSVVSRPFRLLIGGRDTDPAIVAPNPGASGPLESVEMQIMPEFLLLPIVKNSRPVSMEELRLKIERELTIDTTAGMANLLKRASSLRNNRGLLASAFCAIQSAIFPVRPQYWWVSASRVVLEAGIIRIYGNCTVA